MPIKYLSLKHNGRHMRRLSKVIIPPPEFVSATTNIEGMIITITFSKEMADPSGKHPQFTVSDGSANAVTAVALNATTTKIDLMLTNAIEFGDTVTVTYTKGTVESADGGVLASLAAQSVTNTVPEPVALYQEWSGYPESPLLTTDYPYQCIMSSPGYPDELSVSKAPFYVNNILSRMFQRDPYDGKHYNLIDGSWVYDNVYPTYITYTSCEETNHDITTANDPTNIIFYKTT